jgi:CBS domain-containing protein
MQAGDLMTREVVAVTPETPAREIARVLLAHGISAAPVVDSSGLAIGMVSEGDLIGRNETDREARRDWWLALLAEGETLHPDFLGSLRNPSRTAREIMSAPVVTVSETAEAPEIARLLATYRIKRVPVVREGRIVGIVSRADLVRALAANHLEPNRSGHGPQRHGLFADVLTAIDEHFGRAHETAAAAAPSQAAPAAGETDLALDDFRGLAADFEHRKVEQQAEVQRADAEQRRRRVKDLIDHHIADENWRTLLHHAREAAEHGEKEFMLLRFPADLCTDRGRAINAPLPHWPATLRGEAAEIYLRWERDLKPRGFHLAARVLDFPGGFPGDMGLFLVWGE